jgi:hypothetical protein
MNWYYVWGLTISWQNTLILCLGLTISWQNKLILCKGLDHFMTKHTDTMSGAWPFQAPDIVSVCFVMKWSSPRNSISLCCHEMVEPQTIFHDKTDWYYVWGSNISWQHRLILCLGLEHFMTKPTDTMSGAWAFHDKTDWYYVWDLNISWQNRLYSNLRHSISLFWHEIVKPQT